MKRDTIYLKRYCNDGHILRDEFYPKNMREFSVVMKYVRDAVNNGLAHFDIEFVCNSKGFTLIGAL